MLAKGGGPKSRGKHDFSIQISAGWLCIFCFRTWDKDDEDNEDPNVTIVLEVSHQEGRCACHLSFQTMLGLREGGASHFQQVQHAFCSEAVLS